MNNGLKRLVRPLAELYCILALTLAACLAAVGLLATLGIGTVGSLHASLFLGLAPGVGAFVLVWLVSFRYLAQRSRNGMVLNLAAPYRWVVVAALVVALAGSAVLIGTGHSGKSQPCDSGYCKYASGRQVGISTTQYLEDQGGGAIFGGLWSIAVTTVALAMVRGKVKARARRVGRDLSDGRGPDT